MKIQRKLNKQLYKKKKNQHYLFLNDQEKQQLVQTLSVPVSYIPVRISHLKVVRIIT